MPKVCQADTELPDDILEIINAPMILKPQEVKHNMHIDIDQKETFGLKNLPQEWQDLMKKAGLQPEEVNQNPQLMKDIITVIEERMDVNKEFERQKLPNNDEFNKIVSSIVFIEDDPSKYYKFDKNLLGKGAMCKVYSAVDKKNTQNKYAVRVMKLDDKANTLTKIKLEIALMEMIKHKNIVKYKESYLYMECLFMVIEFMDGGALTDVIYSYFGKIKENVIAYVC